MDILEKNWKHHLSVAVAGLVLGLASDKVLKHKTVNVSSAGTAAMSFVSLGAASVAADFAMSKMKESR